MANQDFIKNRYLLGKNGALPSEEKPYEVMGQGSSLKDPEAMQGEVATSLGQASVQEEEQRQRYIQGAGALGEQQRYQQLRFSQRLMRRKIDDQMRTASLRDMDREIQEMDKKLDNEYKKATGKSTSKKAIAIISISSDIICAIIGLIPLLVTQVIADVIAEIAIFIIIIIKMISRPQKIKLSLVAEIKLFTLQALLEFVSAGLLPATTFVNVYITPRVQKRITKNILAVKRRDLMKQIMRKYRIPQSSEKNTSLT